MFVGGTTGVDTILVTPGGAAPGPSRVTINGVSQGQLPPHRGGSSPTAQAGNDRIEVAGSIALSPWLYGGDGDDQLKGGCRQRRARSAARATNVLVGGQGPPTYLLIGGTGG